MASIRSQQLAEQADAFRARAELLSDATELLAASFDGDVPLAAIARLTVPKFADWCLIDLLEDAGRSARVEVAHVGDGGHSLAVQLRPSTEREVLSASSVAFVPMCDDTTVACAKTPERQEILRDLGPRSFVAAPLVARGATLGVLTFLFTDESARHYREEDVQLAVELARRCALAVENARLYGRSQESSRLKDEFLAVLSHELRTPLNAILGWVQILRTNSLAAASREHALEIIERNAAAQAQLVEDLLDVSRIVTGKLRLTMQPMDLTAVIGASIDSVRPIAAAKGIHLDLLVHEAAPMNGDPNRLQQVFWNLLSNALKFTSREGNVSVRLQHADSTVRVIVSDDGRGIAPAFLSHVFDPFRQAEAGATRTHAGLGLGLAIVRQLVELHGGDITAESGGAGQGSTFTVTLPAQPQSTAARVSVRT
ncbi:MAG TPA: GAF domain-containing sensor histidine kinase [Vicinamibacterales bacterium]|nr:GAF domain-containing sensor histidine kinase [Vicinamibacterales bacterium]